MRRFFASSLAWASIFVSSAAWGQRVPVGVMPLQFNPGFAGEAGSPRLSSAFGMSLPTPSETRHSFVASYDVFLPAIRSGIGVSVQQYSGRSSFDVMYPGSYSQSDGYILAAAVAPKFSLKGKYTFSPSAEISYSSGRYEGRYGTMPVNRIMNRSLNARVALLLNGAKWYAGYSVDVPLSNVIRPDSLVTRFYGNRPRNRFNSYWQFGYTFQRTAESKFSVTPQLVFRTGRDPGFLRFRYFGFESINLTFRYQKIIWGLSNAGLHAGYQTERLRVMLCNNVERFHYKESGYTGLLSVRYVFKKAD